MSFPCYRAFAPSSTLTDTVNTRHTFVLVKYDGTVDTSTYTGYGWGGTAAMPWAACHTAAYAAANNYFYVACGPGESSVPTFVPYKISKMRQFQCPSACARTSLAGYAATNSYGSGYGTAVKGSTSNTIYLEPYYTTSPGSYNPRATGVFNGQALATDSTQDVPGFAGIWTLGAGLPTAYGPLQTSLLYGFSGTGMSPWTFVFENATSLYMAEDSAPASYNVLHFVYSSYWSLYETVSFDTTQAIYSIGAVPTQVQNNVSFTLLATTPTALYARTNGGPVILVATPAPGTYFRGVTGVPLNTAWANAAVTPSSSQTPSQTATPTSTPTQSPSPSVTPSTSTTASASQTPSPSNSFGMSK